jgi:hypothetical protein
VGQSVHAQLFSVRQALQGLASLRQQGEVLRLGRLAGPVWAQQLQQGAEPVQARPRVDASLRVEAQVSLLQRERADAPLPA